MPKSLSSPGKLLLALGSAALLALPGAAPAQEHEFAEQLMALAQGQLREIAQNPVVIAAIEAQNAQTAGYGEARINELDTQWRAEVSGATRPLIETTLSNEASQYLTQVQNDSAGLFSEIFVMDARGLNVAQSTVTSDYWQGDEDKFSQSFGLGATGVHLGEIEQDESTQAFQSQVSLTIVDAAGTPIGAITVGVDLALI